jgi:hypothetical protein|tara:strand:- start:1466 stop:1603 length:138 start_codon:yes stop_codon:yes gene_type:complete
MPQDFQPQVVALFPVQVSVVLLTGMPESRLEKFAQVHVPESGQFG